MTEVVPSTKPSDTWLPSAASRRWLNLDWILLGLVLAFCAAWIALRLHPRNTPMEDALMLLRYAQNFAQGHGVRWNLTDPPVDGATDFLFMIATGTLAKVAHIGVIPACRILILAAHFVSVGLVFFAGRTVLGANRWLSASAALYLAVGPATRHAETGFGAPFFAAMLLACWCAALWYALRSTSWPRALVMALFGLLAGLTRPEGVIISGILLLGLAVLIGYRRAIPAAVSMVLVFALLGGPYFLWRWHYFGHPLPNPFYVKGGGHLYLSSVRQAAINVSIMLLPALPLIPLGWLQRTTTRLTTAIVTILVCFTCMWVLLNNWNNHYMRFQYAIIPIVLMTVPALATGFVTQMGMAPWPTLAPKTRLALKASCILALCGALGYFDRLYFFGDAGFGMRDFGRRIAPLAAHGDSMALTEAGTLPFYSEWRIIDGLGLNDAYIAHHGGYVTEDYLAQQNPDVIMIHADGGFGDKFNALLNGDPPVPHTELTNFEVMAHFAHTHGYTLVAAMGSSPCNLHLFLVRPNWPDAPEFIHDLRDFPFYFLDNGSLAHDFRNELPPVGCKS